MGANLNTTNFIQKSQAAHGDTYDYSNVVYINNSTPVTITCKIHGTFAQLPFNHTGYGNSKARGCKQCAIIKKVLMTDKEFVDQANVVHKYKYDYSKVIYKGTDVKVAITCQKHGMWMQAPIKHLAGSGCPKCIGRHQTNQMFVDKARAIHGDTYDYSQVEYSRAHKKVSIICHVHGAFTMTPANHISRQQGCAECKKSKGEIEIKSILTTMGISFIQQHTFKDCVNPKTGRRLKFDFTIPSKNIIIEYDGIQHYKFTPRYHRNLDEFVQTQTFDNIKNQFCKDNGWILVRIMYNQNIKQQIIKVLNISQ